ncbi:zinc finger protein [Gaeumannomyces tritici R3-111a-1]|uniref:Zinc finger protein n=1 Tax=Gaeumannomyces tritici (strain R3-111a-1) TaxID=644352 RepID=J3PAI3_GAET3|nr:zinc finger protein [Gaeumannomyces tritici R3-111a-1]EJT71249.1 zinc finger protein [Gaeumannomyces tritici R3-111a-1]
MPSRHLSSDPEDYNMLYPEPPQGAFGSAPLEMNVSPDAYYPRVSAQEYPTTMHFDASALYTETPYGVFAKPNGLMSPAMYADDGEMRLPSSNLSIASNGSAPSSAHGSPRSAHQPVPEWAGAHALPGIVGQSDYFAPGAEYSFAPAPSMDEFSAAFEYAQQHSKPPGFVDPSLIHPGITRPLEIPTFESAYPAPPPSAYPVSPALTGSPNVRNGSTSPFVPNHNYYPHGQFAAPPEPRRQSLHSFTSGYSAEPHNSDGETSKEKQRCPHPECGRKFKDLKAHMLTHQEERPEKCPIQTCDYHVKGFARKYDKNRHTLTHYKGTMVCGFCPGSGSAAEKSFNRADVFKRHLTAVHGVEQTPPNSRKKAAAAAGASKKLTGYAPDATGKCSTCSATFSNAQDFYEHLDDCVLRIVQQEDPAEAINAKRLAEVAEDREVHATLEKNQLPTATMTSPFSDDDDEEMYEEECEDESRVRAGGKSTASPSKKKGGNPANGVQKSRGMTHSRNGPAHIKQAKGRKSRRDYPTSWGFDKGQMTMKKRVMTVFDGPRRLAKDDMMLSTEHEVRIKLQDEKAYVTDLDIQTMRRAQGFLDATDEEKGPWISDDLTEEQRRQLHAAGQ